MSANSHGGTPYYFVPGPSRHPAMAALGLFFVILGAGQWVNGSDWGKYALLFGLVFWLFVLYQWFGEAIAESEAGSYGHKVDLSFRWSMSWGIIEPFQTMTPFWLPTINTALLLSSGVTLTIAHHALRENQRSRTITFMWLTVLLGIVFLFVQGYEYAHAYSDMNLKLTSGAYGSTFYMLTGFHGFHVFLGMLMLLVITLRLQKGHFNADKHFGFEGAAWYWHFVDVVWLGLYILVYWM